MTLTFGGRSTAHAPVAARSKLALFHSRLNHNRYITPPRLLVPGSKGLHKIKLWETKIKNKKYNKKIKEKLSLGGAAAGGDPRAADGEGAGRNLVQPKLAARCLQGWLEKMPATLGAAWLVGVDQLALGNSGEE